MDLDCGLFQRKKLIDLLCVSTDKGKLLVCCGFIEQQLAIRWVVTMFFKRQAYVLSLRVDRKKLEMLIQSDLLEFAVYK